MPWELVFANVVSIVELDWVAVMADAEAGTGVALVAGAAVLWVLVAVKAAAADELVSGSRHSGRIAVK